MMKLRKEAGPEPATPPINLKIRKCDEVSCEAEREREWKENVGDIGRITLMENRSVRAGPREV